MDDLIGRVARAIDAELDVDLDSPEDELGACTITGQAAAAEAAVREVLAAMREPSEAIRRPFWGWRLFGIPKLEGAWAAAVDIRAREHGL